MLGRILLFLKELLGLGTPVILSLSPGLPGFQNAGGEPSLAEAYEELVQAADHLLEGARIFLELDHLQEAERYCKQAGELLRTSSSIPEELHRKLQVIERGISYKQEARKSELSA